MIGTRLSDRYEITGELGRGGMGVVYRARDPVLDREVAVKLIPPGHVSPDMEQRFQREAQLVAQMDHPGIVPIHDFGRHGDSLFLVMPVVPGKSLRAVLREGALALGDVLEIGIQVAEALHYSHSRGVVHRDVKPENVMVVREPGGALRARVMDFGLAVATSQARMTQTGVVVGTLGYLSPEQVRARDVDHRSDVYSLGSVLYECVAGNPPFSGEIQSVLYRIVHEAVQPPSAVGVQVDPELESIVLACLAVEPSERTQSAQDVAAGLRAYRARLRDSDRVRMLGTPSSTQLPRPAAAPFVGRQKEMLELQQRLNAAIAGECQFVLVGGEPGTGKTRLLDEIEGLARARHLRVLHGRFFEQERALPYQGFCEAIVEYFRGREAGGSSSELPDFADLLPELSALSPILAEVQGARPGSAPDAGARTAPAPVAAAGDRTHVFELLSRTLARLAAGKPLVLLLEDLHHAEVSLEALQYVVRRLGTTPTLVVGTYRTTGVDRSHPLQRLVKGFQGDRRFGSIVVGPLPAPEHRLLVETLLGGADLADDLCARLHEATEGNPYFTKEMIRSLLDQGAIARDDAGAWSLAGGGLVADALPATIQQAVETRIERLPAEFRQVLSVAAVLGRTFDFRDLEALSEGAKDLDDAVERLVREGLLEEDRESRGDRLAFASGVVRDVLLAQLSRRARRSLHRRAAEQVESRMAGRLDRVLPDLLHHYAEADVPEKAVEFGTLLARRAIDGHSPEDAVRAARTALEFVDEEWRGNPATEAELRLLLARGLRQTGDAEAAVKQAESAARVFESAGDGRRTAESLLIAADAAWQARRTDDAGRVVARGIETSRAAGATETLVRFLSLGATLATLRGEHERAAGLLEEVTKLSSVARKATDEAQALGGCLVVALSAPVRAAEPAAMEVTEDTEVLTNVFETLVATDDTGALVPHLCERWSVEDGGLSVSIVLRDGVRFSDGHALSASDVKRSFERAVRNAGRQIPVGFAALAGIEAFRRGEADGIDGIVVRSAAEIVLRLGSPLPVYPALLTDFYTGIVREVGDASGPGRGLLGTGPFRVGARTAERLVLERNESYWRGATTRLDAVEFRLDVTPGAAAAGLRSGEIDLARDLVPQDLEDLLRDARFRRGLVEAPQKNTYFLGFRVAEGPTADPVLRRALLGAVRVQDVVWGALGRFAQPALCLLPPGILGHDPGRRRTTMTREEASTHIAAAAGAAVIRLRAVVHPVLHERGGALLDAIFRTWADVGVTVDAPRVSLAEYLERFEDPGECDLIVARWTPDYDDPDAIAYELFHSRAGRLRRWFSSSDTDRMLEEARAEAKPRQRELLYRRFESALAETGAVLPLFHDVQYRVASPRVRGLRLRSSPPFVNYAEIACAAPEAAPEERTTARGALRVPLAGVVATIDPARITIEEELEVSTAVFETLTRKAEGAWIVPWLAAALRVEAGGSRYRFRLREDARFHDGRRLGARDVRHSFERVLRNSALYGSYLSRIRGAEAFARGEADEIEGFQVLSAAEFVLDLAEPVAFFPAVLAHPALGIVPEGVERLDGSWKEGCVGTGPFRILEFVPGRRLELERNPLYARAGFPRAERLSMTFGVPPREMFEGFRAGRFSLCGGLLPNDVESLRRDPKFADGYRETPQLSTYFVAFNARRAPCSGRSFGAGLVAAVDVAATVRHALGRMAVPAAGLVPPGLLGDDLQDRRPRHAAPRAPRHGTAVQLAAAVHPAFLGSLATLADPVFREFRRAGAEVRVGTKDMDEYLDAVRSGTADLVLGRWLADYPDADTFARELHSRVGFLGRICGLPEADALIERGRREPDLAARHGIYRQLEEVLAREALLLPLFHEQAYRFARPEVDGLNVSYWVPVVRYEELSVSG